MPGPGAAKHLAECVIAYCDLATADRKQLIRLPPLGNILAGRLNGRFGAPSELGQLLEWRASWDRTSSRDGGRRSRWRGGGQGGLEPVHPRACASPPAGNNVEVHGGQQDLAFDMRDVVVDLRPTIAGPVDVDDRSALAHLRRLSRSARNQCPRCAGAPS